MKKFIILLFVLVIATLGLSANTYTYSGTDTIFIGGSKVITGASVVFDDFVYIDNFTLATADPDTIYMDVTSVSTTAATTQTFTVSELADVKIDIDWTAGALTLYFNDLTNDGVSIGADWNKTLSTKYFNKFYIKNTATTTTYTVVIERVLP